MKPLHEIADSKPWFADDERLKHVGQDNYGCDKYKWYTVGNYITSTQIDMAVSDPDVSIGDICKNDNVGFYIDIKDVR